MSETERSHEGDVELAAWVQKNHAILRFAVEPSVITSLSMDASAVLSALREAWRLQSDRDSAELEHREACALVALFGRRFAEMRVPALAAVASFQSLRDVAITAGLRFPYAAYDSLLALFVDGFARGLEDASRESALRSVADAIEIVRLAPGAYLVAIRSLLDPIIAERVASRLGRLLLREETFGCVLSFVELQGVTDDAPRVVGPFLDTCTAMGVTLRVVCSPDARDAIVATKPMSARLEFATDLAAAVRDSLADAGYRTIRSSSLAGRLASFRGMR